MFGNDFDENSDERFLDLYQQSLETWREQDISSYDYDYYIRRGNNVRGPFSVAVRDGDVVAAQNSSGNPVPLSDEDIRTISEQFDFIEDIFARHESRFSSDFDTIFGYPTFMISQMPSGMIVELGIARSAFQPVEEGDEESPGDDVASQVARR